MDNERELMELKPCPFCGGTGLRVKLAGYDTRQSVKFFQVKCDNCLALGPKVMQEHAAISAWNQRQEMSDD